MKKGIKNLLRVFLFISLLLIAVVIFAIIPIICFAPLSQHQTAIRNPICPNCKVGTKRVYMGTKYIKVDNPFIYNEQGNIISGTSCIKIETWKCLKCGTVYMWYEDLSDLLGEGYYKPNMSFEINLKE